MNAKAATPEPTAMPAETKPRKKPERSIEHKAAALVGEIRKSRKAVEAERARHAKRMGELDAEAKAIQADAEPAVREMALRLLGEAS
jgi:hypothetical protein